MNRIQHLFLFLAGILMGLLISAVCGCHRQDPPRNMAEAYFAGEEVPSGGYLYVGGPYNPRWPHHAWHNEIIRELRAAGWEKPIVIGQLRMGAEEQVDPGAWAREHQRRAHCIAYWLPLGQDMGIGLETRIDFGISVGMNSNVNRFRVPVLAGAPPHAMGVGTFRRIAMENGIPFLSSMKELAEKAVEHCK